MGFDDLVDCSSFVSSAIGQMGVSVGQASHAIGELTKAVGAYSSLPYRQPAEKKLFTIVKMSIVRKPVLKVDGIKNATLTVDSEKINWDVLEKNFRPFNKGDVVFYK